MSIRDLIKYEPGTLTAPETIEDMNRFVAQLQAELYRLANALEGAHELEIAKEPLRSYLDGVPSAQTVQAPVDPGLYYCDSGTFDPGLGTGLYLYRDGAWYLLDSTVVP